MIKVVVAYDIVKHKVLYERVALEKISFHVEVCDAHPVVFEYLFQRR